jgi:nucleoside-diphosphate-sugar epimerase
VALGAAVVVLVAVTAQEVLMQEQVADVAAAAERVALVAGATGLVGRAVLADLLTDKRYKAVHCVGRRPSGIDHPKLTNHVVDFNQLTFIPGLDHVDDVFIALGTTINLFSSVDPLKIPKN